MKLVTLSLVTSLSLFFFGCSSYHKYDLSKTMTVRAGDNQETVLKKLGNPVADELADGITTLHYCTTGYGSDRFVAIYLKDNFVIAKKNYTVTIDDTNGVTGPCFNFVKRGSYIEPETIIQLRSKININ